MCARGDDTVKGARVIRELGFDDALPTSMIHDLTGRRPLGERQ